MGLLEEIQEKKAKAKERTDKAEATIRDAILKNGPYSHNIVSLTLGNVAREVGVEAANDLVDKCKLTRLYGIQKVEA